MFNCSLFLFVLPYISNILDMVFIYFLNDRLHLDSLLQETISSPNLHSAPEKGIFFSELCEEPKFS